VNVTCIELWSFVSLFLIGLCMLILVTAAIVMSSHGVFFFGLFLAMNGSWMVV
jgi:hypothetical protein